MLKTKHIIVLPVSLLVLTVIFGTFLSSTVVKADNSTVDTVNVTINTACTITTGGGTYSESINPGSSKEITSNNVNVSCNDSGGYALYAIGFSGDSYDAPNNNRMLGPDSNYIPTANSGTNSYWAMKVAASSTTSTVPTIDNSYSSYQIIPATYTKISHYSSITVGTTANSVTTPTYKVNVSPAQTAGTYTGKVKYTIVHPNNAPAPTPPDPGLCTDAATCMQTMTTCPTTPTTVTDGRDGEQYLVQRLADGNCWMLDNLRLGGSSAMNLTPSNTNINSNWTLPASTTTGFDSSTGYTTAAVNADYKSTTTTSYGAGSGKIGNYYNYCAASGGTYCSDSGTGDAQYDICPAGWRMPTSGKYQGSGVGDGEYFALGAALGLTFDEDWWGFTGTTYQTALSTPLSGSFYNGSALAQGNAGLWWASTESNDGYMYSLYVDSGTVYSTDNRSSRYRGSSLRCILDS